MLRPPLSPGGWARLSPGSRSWCSCQGRPSGCPSSTGLGKPVARSQLISCPLHIWKQMPGCSRTGMRLNSWLLRVLLLPLLMIWAMSLFSHHSRCLIPSFSQVIHNSSYSYQPTFLASFRCQRPRQHRTSKNPVSPSSSRTAVLSLWAVPCPVARALTLPVKTGQTHLKPEQFEMGFSHLTQCRFGKFSGRAETGLRPRSAEAALS